MSISLGFPLRSLVSILLLALLLPQKSLADKELKNLSPVSVAIFGVEDKTLKSELKTKVELTLRKAGIKIATESGERKASVSFNVLTLTSKNSDGSIRGYSYTTDLQVRARTFVIENSEVTTATIWEAVRYIGTSSRTKFYPALKERATEAAESFANAYLEANPK